MRVDTGVSHDTAREGLLNALAAWAAIFSRSGGAVVRRKRWRG